MRDRLKTIVAGLAELRELSALLPYLKKHRRRVGTGIAFIIITNFFALLAPRVLQYAIDSLRLEITANRLAYFAALIVGVSAAEGIFRFLMRQTIIVFSRQVEYELRNDYFAHLQRMSRSFFNRYAIGDLMARATNDLSSVRAVVGPGIMYSSNTLVVGIGAFALMLSLNVKLTLVVMLTFPVMFFIVKYAMGAIHRTFNSIQEQFSKVTAQVQENLSGIRVIKSYQRESFEIGKFSDLNRVYMDQNVTLGKIRGFLWSAMQLFSGIGVLLLLWVGGLEVMHDRLSWGEFVAFFSYLGMMTWPVIALGWVINVIQQGTASMARISRIMREAPEIRDHAVTRHEMRELTGEIEFRNVSFGYAAERPVLQNINLKIPAGMTLAIVGHTGSGKSTLVNLICRLYDPTAGHVLIDDIDVRDIPLAVLHRNIGMVPQETFLFSDAIKENLGFGLENGHTDLIYEAAAIAHIRGEIEEFPKSYETMLGERGINLSGGQKQRVAIARAIARQPSILILDDALSAVDTYTEDKILQSLQGVMRKRTSIIISHRISTVQNADLIIVLEHGNVVEKGTHESLMAQGGLYAELSRMQQLEADLEAI